VTSDRKQTFSTQSEAKRFFIERVLQQAQVEGVQLSAAERAMLGWSESDPQFDPDPLLPQKLAAEMDDDEYEDKIVDLLDGGYRREIASNPEAKELYRQAYSVLRQGDHYLLVFIKRALGSELRRGWSWWR
jgi:hypothetical protein